MSVDNPIDADPSVYKLLLILVLPVVMSSASDGVVVPTPILPMTYTLLLNSALPLLTLNDSGVELLLSPALFPTPMALVMNMLELSIPKVGLVLEPAPKKRDCEALPARMQMSPFFVPSKNAPSLGATSIYTKGGFSLLFMLCKSLVITKQ